MTANFIAHQALEIERLIEENKRLQIMILSMSERIAGQSELLSKRAEKSQGCNCRDKLRREVMVG